MNNTKTLPTGISWARIRESRDTYVEPPPRPRRVKKSEYLVLAARGLGKVGTVFTIETLVIAAWMSYPEQFGMVGGQYPDSHAVSGILFSKLGPIGREWMVRAGKGRYRLTEASEWIVGE